MMAATLGAGREFQPSPSFRGSIELILGPMFSGKTTELFRRIRRYTFANYRCIVIKYRKDQRYAAAGEASTHDQLMFAANPCERLAEAVDEVANFDVIGIDEGQFFPDLLEFSEKWANTGKVVIVSALDGTFQRKAFGRTLELIPLAEKVDKLRAVCMLCYGDASFTKRISTDDNRIEVIGGSEAYVSTCRKCFLAPGTGPITPLKHPGLFSPRTRTLSHASSQSVGSGSQTVTDTDNEVSSTSTPDFSPSLSSFPTPAPVVNVSRSTATAESHAALSISTSSSPPPTPSDKENFSLLALNDALPTFTDQKSLSLREEVCGKISKLKQETTVARERNSEVKNVPADVEERKDRANRSSRSVLTSVSTNK